MSSSRSLSRPTSPLTPDGQMEASAAADDLNPFQIDDDSDAEGDKPVGVGVGVGVGAGSGSGSGQSTNTAPREHHDDDDDAAAAAAAAAASLDSPWATPSSPQQHTQTTQHSAPAPAPTQSTQRSATQPLPPPDIDMTSIAIIDAQKTTDHVGASSFIVYVIRSETTEAKRRYSEFEALRSALVQLHPTLIIPPIPSKHSLSDYAVKQSKAKEDATIIARRKRMLQSFLRRCASHPDISASVVFRKFLDGRWTWHELSTSPPLSLLPKNNLRAPAANPADPEASPAYAALPLPSSSSSGSGTTAAGQLRNPNQRFIDSETFTNRFAAHMSNSLEKANRRVARRWGDAAGDYAELGAVLNGFSLSESGQLATAIERMGQASDSTFLSIGGLLQDWEQSLTEPLQEYVQFAAILQKLLKWRHLKHLQYELAQDALEAKKMKLDDLERVEAEAKRLERALETGGRSLARGGGGGRGASAWDAQAQAQGGSSSSRIKSSIYGGAVEQDEQEQAQAHAQGHGDPDTHVNGAAGTGESAWSNHVPEGSSGSGGGSGAGSTYRERASSSRPRPSASSHSSSGGGGGGGGGGLLSALSHTFSSVLDVDPEQTRRREISRLREEILTLDEALALTEQDLKYATARIQADLDRFQRGKIRDLREVLLASARMHREVCRVNLRNWEAAKGEIEEVQSERGSARAGAGAGTGGGAAAKEWPSGVMPESSLARSERREREG